MNQRHIRSKQQTLVYIERDFVKIEMKKKKNLKE